MTHWSLSDIPWHRFDAGKVQPELVSLAKAACMVEHNGEDYVRYLQEVFADAPELHATIAQWGAEEVQHGEALARWVSLADPAFDFDKSFSDFTGSYKLPQQVTASVRGSRYGELIARCVVETGTSNYYTAIKEYAQEPVLKAICARIAADEFRHYKLFYELAKKYQSQDRLSALSRLGIALKRVLESGDDELAYAFFAAQHANNPSFYDRKTCAQQYLACAGQVYRKRHIEKMTSMIFKAANVKLHSAIHRLISALAWQVMQLRVRQWTRRQQAQA